MPLKEFNIVFCMEEGELLVRGGSRKVEVHGVLHAVCEYDLVGECEPPWLHGVCLTEVLPFHSWIGMI